MISEKMQLNLTDADRRFQMSRLETARAELESAKAWAELESAKEWGATKAEIQCLEAENTRLQEQASQARAKAEELRQNLALVETEREGFADKCGETKTYDGLLAEVLQE